MSDLSTAVAEQQEGLPLNIEEVQPINLEVPGEATETPPPEKKKGRPPANVIITSLKNEKSELLTANERLAQELDEERRQAREAKAQLAQQAQSFTRQNIALNEQRLKAQADSARQLFRDARISNDPDKEAEATAAIARAESGLQDIESWKASNPEQQRPAQQQQQPQQQEQQFQAPQFDADTQAWMNENAWFMQLKDGKQNPEFNKTMHMFAVAYASQIEDEMAAAGQRDKIGKADYWTRINEEMSKKFPEAYGEEEEPEVVIERPRVTVAPAVRSAPASSTGKSKTHTVQLSGQERALVDNMREGGSMKYPMGHEKAGQRMGAMDSYLAYWKEKQKGN